MGFLTKRVSQRRPTPSPDALLPLVGYLLGLIAAVLLVMQAAASANLIAAAVLTLLLAAIRNAWDMMVWIVIKTPSGGMPPP